MRTWPCLPGGISSSGAPSAIAGQLERVPLCTRILGLPYFTGRHGGTIHDGARVSCEPGTFLNGCVGSQEPSNSPADLNAKKCSPCVPTKQRPSLTGQGQGLVSESFGRVEEGPYLPLAVRNGLSGHWGLWYHLISQYLQIPSMRPHGPAQLREALEAFLLPGEQVAQNFFKSLWREAL